MDFELQNIPEDPYLINVVYKSFRIGQAMFSGSIWKYRIDGNPTFSSHSYESAMDAGHGLLNEIGDIEKFVYGIS